MAEMRKTLYGDGTHTVLVDDEVAQVEFITAGITVLVLSHDAFREVVLGWERHESET
jgi:hypothetical protein